MSESIFKLLYWNLGLAGTWSASSSQPTLPPSNLGLPGRGLPWQSLIASDQWIKVQLATGGAFGMGSQVGGPDQLGGAAEAIIVGGAALIDSNLTTDAVVTLQGNNTDDWANPAFSQTLVPWDASRRGVMPLFLAADQMLPWWRWVLDDPTNPHGFLQIGVAPIGPALIWEDEPGVAAALGIGMGPRLIDPSLRGRAPSGTPYAFEYPKLYAMNLPTGPMREAWLFDRLWPVLERVGLTRDVVASLYATDPSGTGGNEGIARTTNVYGRFDGDLSMPAENLFYRGMLDIVESR